MLDPMGETYFHPLVQRWFDDRFEAPTDAQQAGWPAIRAGNDTLIAAPTGSGKTLAAFLWSIDKLVRDSLEGRLENRTYAIYVSPLKALGNDVRKNLQDPLSGIEALAEQAGIERPELRIAVRSGDTPQSERRAMLKRPPHILITTPESLYILLTAEGSRAFLSTADTVIVDEIHAVAGDKRGSHLSLSLERLDRLVGRRLQRIGLSATQRPIEQIGALLSGNADSPVEIVDLGHQREMDLAIETTDHELGPIGTLELWSDVYDRIAEHVRAHRTTLVYVNTRRLAERVAFQLTSRLGEGKVAAHHGSLSRRARLEAEQGLKSGQVPAVVATASLELGIDIGHVDLVVHVGAPRSMASLLQRVGRSAHRPGSLEMPKGILFPLTRDELLQSAASVRAVTAGDLDRVIMPRNPLDILAQQIVAITASEEIGEVELYDLVRRAYPFSDLPREDFLDVVEMLSEGVATERGRRSAHIHRDRVNGTLRGRRGARLAAITGGGAIPDTADYDVLLEPEGSFVGRVNEDFAIESMAGDIFLLGNRSWKIRRIGSGKVHVEDAQGAPPNIPFWLGEAPARTAELSTAVSDLRAEISDRLRDIEVLLDWLQAECGLDRGGAEQLVAYISETVAALGAVPTKSTVIAERFFDEAGGMQLVVHSPFGGRINRAWGLAMRKRFCVTFDFELQAAATDDGFVLSLGEQHSFPVENAFKLVRADNADHALVQATLAVPMFVNRWRWNSTRSLALLRFSGGRRVPMPIQRMRGEDLLAAVFPAQVMCQDNRAGDVEIPDHPLVRQTMLDCLHEAMDLEGLQHVLDSITDGKIQTIALDTTGPSPISHEILNANPYAFLDDAPLEERRARAVALRRTDPELGRGIGALDPAAIEEVRLQSWPDVRDAHELHDALLNLSLIPIEEGQEWSEPFEELVQQGRASIANWTVEGSQRKAFVAAERIRLVQEAIPGIEFSPLLSPPAPSEREQAWMDRGEVPRVIVQGWLECVGPTTAEGLARRLGLSRTDVEIAFAQLEAEGVVLRGQFEPASRDIEWCDRRLLARIHRRTINKLRREIQSVSAADLIRFLFRWQHVQPGRQLHGQEGVLHVMRQLQGLELPAPAWDRDVLPARIEGYKPSDLEDLCLSGILAWGRLRGRPSEEPRALYRPTRSAPLGFALREDLPIWMEPLPSISELKQQLSPSAQTVLNYLTTHGASFQSDIERRTELLGTQVEEALWELVANGLVTGDGLAGLRSLLLPPDRRRRARRLRARRGALAIGPLGRWSVLQREDGMDSEDADDAIARQLLNRYGVVFRELLTRETRIPGWRRLLRVFREMELRGEIRGGRFVDGFIGEQFALTEAVEELRAVRRDSGDVGSVIVSTADPLNLVGILTPGERVSPLSHQMILYENGVPVEIGTIGAIRHRQSPEPSRSTETT